MSTEDEIFLILLISSADVFMLLVVAADRLFVGWLVGWLVGLS